MKPYLTIHHKIQEWIGIVTGLASLIVAIVMMVVIKNPIPMHYDAAGNVTKYGSAGFVIIMPIMMLPTILILWAATHFFPLSLWNLPVKPKPGREIRLYRISAYMVTLFNMLTGLFSLFFTIFMGLGKIKAVGTLSFILCALMIGVAVWAIVKSILVNR